MTTRQALLAAILAQPDDDTARLVYADFLQDNGEPERAEFVRVQVELAKIPPKNPPNVPIAELRRRERELRDTKVDGSNQTNGYAWAGIVPNHSERFDYSRGFVSWMHTPWDRWRDYAAAILAEHPVEEVTLTTNPDYPWLLATCALPRDDVRAMIDDALKKDWPRITFHLPPPAPTIPLDGWRIELDSEAPGMQARLTRVVDDAPTNILYDVIGPVVATDDEGRQWTCQIVLNTMEWENGWDANFGGTRRLHLSAVSVGEVRRVREPVTLQAHRIHSAIQVPREWLEGDGLRIAAQPAQGTAIQMPATWIEVPDDDPPS